MPVMSLAQEVAGRSLIKNDRAVVIPWELPDSRASQRCCAEHYQTFQALSSAQNSVAVALGDRVDGGLGSAWV